MKRTFFAFLAGLLLILLQWRTFQHSPQTIHAQTTADCNPGILTFTGSGALSSAANLSANTPCVAWRVTLSVTGTLAATVQFETSPDNSSFTAVPNTICSASVQPPCLTDGANPLGTLLTQGTAAIRAYGAYVRVNVTAISGSGTGTIRIYGYKGTSASAGTGSGGGSGPTGPTGPTGATGPTGPAGGGGSAAGPTGAVQAAGTAGAFADSGCTTTSGAMSCVKYASTGSGAGGFASLVTNAGTTGTTAKLLSKINASGNAVIATTTDTAIPVWITLATDATLGCTAGTTGSACLVSAGQGTCTADAGGITAGHYVINSTVTNGRCRDGGTSAPAVYSIGVAVTAAAGNADSVVQVATSAGGPSGPTGPTGPTGPAGGGGSNTSGPIASLPGTCNSGDLYFATNSVYTAILCGAGNSHTYWGDFGLLTPPPSASWTWDNQASGTIDSTNGYEYMSVPKSGSVNITMRYRTAPATPYTLTALLLHDHSGAQPGVSGTSNNSGYGLAFRDGTGKISTFRISADGSGIAIVTDKWTTSTSFSALYQNYQFALGTPTLLDLWTRQKTWFQLQDTGTNLLYLWSIDGQHWKQFFSVSRTDWFGSGPTQIGFFAYTNGDAVEVAPISWIAQ